MVKKRRVVGWVSRFGDKIVVNTIYNLTRKTLFLGDRYGHERN